MTRHKHAVVSYMGPLLVLVSLALRHRNTIIERMNTTRATATAEIISMRRPSLVSYQWASSVGQTWRKTCITRNAKSAKVFTFCLQAKLLKATLCLFVIEKTAFLTVQTVTALYAALIFKKPACYNLQELADRPCYVHNFPNLMVMFGGEKKKKRDFSESSL